jgi:hypothetical protein
MTMLAETPIAVSREGSSHLAIERRGSDSPALDHRPPIPDVDALVRDLRQLYCVKGIELMVRIGELIVERIYAGDCAKWRSHGRKNTSFRKLSSHPDLPFHASQLSRAVSIYLLSQRRPELVRFAHVGPSHLQEILGLEQEEQDRLLRCVEAESWSTRRLREEVRACQPRADRRGGPRKLPSFQRCVQQWSERIESRTLLTDLDAIGHLPPETARSLLASVRTLCQQSEFLARQLVLRVTAVDRASSPPPNVPLRIAATLRPPMKGAPSGSLAG